MKDTGGMESLLPVISKLRSAGTEVVIAASGVSRQNLHARGIEFFDASTAQDIVDHFPNPQLFVTSMCTTGGPGRDTIPLLLGRTKTVVVQDQWGVLTEWLEKKYCPDFVVVNDIVGKSLILKAWNNMPVQVRILGYAVLDSLSSFDVSEARDSLRRVLSIPKEKKIVFFGGQLKGTGTALLELVTALNTVCPTCDILLGTHPRFSLDNVALLDEAALIERARHIFCGNIIDLPPNKLISPVAAAAAAADVTVSMSSTAVMYSAAMRKPSISLMYPDSTMWAQYDKERGGLVPEFPLATIGCVAAPLNEAELRKCLSHFLFNGANKEMTSAQKKHLVVDGKNTARIAAFIRTLL